MLILNIYPLDTGCKLLARIYRKAITGHSLTILQLTAPSGGCVGWLDRGESSRQHEREAWSLTATSELFFTAFNLTLKLPFFPIVPSIRLPPHAARLCVIERSIICSVFLILVKAHLELILTVWLRTSFDWTVLNLWQNKIACAIFLFMQIW